MQIGEKVKAVLAYLKLISNPFAQRSLLKCQIQERWTLDFIWRTHHEIILPLHQLSHEEQKKEIIDSIGSSKISCIEYLLLHFF
jgi:hypothetical protein